MKVEEVTSANIKDVIASSKRLVIDIWAQWCGPCRQMMPIVEKLAEKYDGQITVRKFDAEPNEHQDICADYGVTHIPTFLFFSDGELVNRHVGPCSEKDLAQLFDAIL